MDADYYDSILNQRGAAEAFAIAADDARKLRALLQEWLQPCTHIGYRDLEQRTKKFLKVKE